MNKTITPETTVGQIVAAKPSRSRVFEKLGLDYCCGGKKPLSAACAEKGLDTNTVVAMLEATEGLDTAQAGTDPQSMTMTELCDHIVNTHHAYLNEELPRIEALTQKVANTHGGKWPWAVEVAKVFSGLKDELESHTMKEERILFPAIRDLEAGRPSTSPCGDHIDGPISVMEAEHDEAGRALAKLSELTSGFTPPPGACNTTCAMIDALKELEQNTHVHVHKENNVLFPQAMARFCQ